MQNSPTPQGQQICLYATTLIGKDARTYANDAEVGCADAVSTILHHLFPLFAVVTGTYSLYQIFQGAAEFVLVTNPLAGDVIISPTGLGGRNGIVNGHVGIMGADGDTIMSNNSDDGLWETKYNLASWKERYATIGGYPVIFFRRIMN